MDAYAFLSKIDDESFLVVQELSRFSVRTVGDSAAYAALTGESIQDLRELGERIGAVVPGDVRLLISGETPTTAMSERPPGWPFICYDKETGAIDYDCLGTPSVSYGPKFASFAIVELSAARGVREGLHARLTLTGNVIGMSRLLDPSGLLVEVGNPDRERVLRTLDEIAALPEVQRARASIATTLLDAPPTSD